MPGGTMRAFVLSGPGRGAVHDVERPTARPGQVVVDVERAGVCGTDVEFYTGEMAYLHDGHAQYPMRLGHEWCGTVTAVGADADAEWLAHRVTGDTMLGCGQCDRCRSGRRHVCADRFEVGIRSGWPGALAEQLLVPAGSLRRLPPAVGPVAGALVEPGGNALRAVRAAGVGPGRRVLIFGPGTIGLLCAQFAVATGAEVHVAGPAGVSVTGRAEASAALARGLGVDGVWTADTIPDLAFDAVIDASTGVDVPARALALVEPGGRVVYIGLAGEPSSIDTRALVLGDVTAVGILSASPGLDGAIEAYAEGRVDPRPLVAATVDWTRWPTSWPGSAERAGGPGRRCRSTRGGEVGRFSPPRPRLWPRPSSAA